MTLQTVQMLKQQYRDAMIGKNQQPMKIILMALLRVAKKLAVLTKLKRN